MCDKKLQEQISDNRERIDRALLKHQEAVIRLLAAVKPLAKNTAVTSA